MDMVVFIWLKKLIIYIYFEDDCDVDDLVQYNLIDLYDTLFYIIILLLLLLLLLLSLL